MSTQSHAHANCPPGPWDQSALNIATKDKFVMVLSLPQIFLEQAKHDNNPLFKIKNLEMTVFGTVMPEISVPAVDVPILGQTYKVTSLNRPAYSPLTVSFIVDNEYKNYQMLWHWLNLYNDAKNSGYNGPDNNAKKLNETEYQTSFSIYGLTEYNAAAIEFYFSNAFITKLGSLTYNYKDGEQLECSADFVFNQLLVKSTRKK